MKTGYIENTNKQKAGTEFENKTIEEIMLHAGGSKGYYTEIFHSFVIK